MSEPIDLDEIARGERFYQQLLDEERVPVPASLRATSVDFTEPMAIAPNRYFAPEFHAREVEHVWGRVWQMACREEQLPEVGDSLVYEIADWSLIVVRTTVDEIRAFHNSCLHRGTQLRTGAGRGQYRHSQWIGRGIPLKYAKTSSALLRRFRILRRTSCTRLVHHRRLRRR